MPATLAALSGFFRSGPTTAAKLAAIGAELEELRTRKRSYISQIEHLDARRSLDAETLYARETLLELIAQTVSRELDLLDALDALRR